MFSYFKFLQNITESDHRTSKRKNDISNLNTLKKKKKYETALAAIFPENDQSYLQYAQGRYATIL